MEVVLDGISQSSVGAISRFSPSYVWFEVNKAFIKEGRMACGGDVDCGRSKLGIFTASFRNSCCVVI